MKRIWLLLGAVLAAAVLLAACASKGGTTVAEDGGTTDSTDPGAPKTIQSTEIKRFSCSFSTGGILEEELLFESGSYELKAVAKPAVSGRWSYTNNGESQKADFTADPTFMQDLQKIVTKYNLAQHNGYSQNTAGLPEGYGAEIDILYASGETITAYDNSECFLSTDCMAEMLALFLEASDEEDLEPELETEPVKNRPERAPGTKKEDLPTQPDLIPIYLTEESVWENMGGCAISLRYPGIHTGYINYDGSTTGTGDYPALEEALSIYNRDLIMTHNSDLARLRYGAENQLIEEGTYPEFYIYKDLQITRSDSAVISFCRQDRYYETWEFELFFWDAHNIDPLTGEELTFSNVFTDLKQLPSILADELRTAYPDVDFDPDIESKIAETFRAEYPNLHFALSYGCVYFYAGEYWLANEPVGYQVVLPLADHPDLVREKYRLAPNDWVLPLQYDTDYYTADGIRLRLTCESFDQWEGQVRQTLMLGDRSYSEIFFGYPPECYLVTKDGCSYLYLRIPTGDIAPASYIYPLSGDEREMPNELPVALRSDSPLTPDRLLMEIDALLYGEGFILVPYSYYTVSDTGEPILLENCYGLDGPELALAMDEFLVRVDPDDPDILYEIESLPEGLYLKPFRTDLMDYIDLMAADGSIYRYPVDLTEEDYSLSLLTTQYADAVG